jgi:SOS-response transcriptional repressor LexA
MLDSIEERAQRLIATSPALAREIVRQFEVKPRGLTKCQQAALEFVKRFKEQNGVAPTYRETADGLGCSSTAAFYMLHRLQDRGHIEIGSNQRRSITVIAA